MKELAEEEKNRNWERKRQLGF